MQTGPTRRQGLSRDLPPLILDYQQRDFTLPQVDVSTGVLS